MFKLNILTLMLAGILSWAFRPYQQRTDACSVSGKITDASSKAEIPYVSLMLYKADLKVQATTVSNATGDYCFKNVPDGVYMIKVTYTGYQTKEVKNVTLKSGQPVKQDIALSADKKIKDEMVLIQKSQEESLKKYEYDNKNIAPATKAAHDRSGLSAGYFSRQMATGSSADFNTEEYHKIDDNEFKEARKNPLSTFSIDVDKASYSNVRRFITQGSLPPADAVRVEEMINYFSYKYKQPDSEHPFSITTEYTECPWNAQHNLIHIGIQGKEIKLDHMPANNLVFLVDVSGSMEEPNKLPLLKSGLRLLVEQMRAQDKVSIVVYAGAAGVVLPPTSGEHKEKILDALEQLHAGGSTAGGEGILLAYKTAKENFMEKGNNRVILATDGDFNVGVSSEGELTRLIEKEREAGVFLTVLGFGTGNYKDSKMEQLADKGNGNYAYVDNILEAKKVLVKEMGGTLLTIAKDVKIQIEFNPAKVKAYRLVGYENRLLNNEDFNDDKKDAGELGSGHTVTAIYELIPAGSSEPVASVDSLKYQNTVQLPKSLSNEVMTIKFRYKEPKEEVSKLITRTVTDSKVSFERSSENCRFAASVAEFGMLLRDSKFKGKSSYNEVLSLARSAKGTDEEGYRAEFIRLVEMAELLKK